MKKSFNLHTSFTAFVFIMILFASCKKSSDTTPPPPALPVINSFSPATGSAGTTVTISGKNFSPTITNDVVSFNGATAIVTSATADQIIVTVPNDASSGKITVKVLSNTASSTNDFIVLPITASFSVARSGMAAASLGNKIYFGGGYDGAQADGNIDIYDVDAAKWTSAQLSVPRFNFAAASAGHKILFAGGETDLVLPAPVSSVVDIYDDSTKTWLTAHLSEPSYFLSAGSAGNKIIFGGGEVDTGTSYNVDMYDVVNNTWTKHLLNDRRAYANIIGAGNKILVAGGVNGYSSTSNLDYFFRSVDIYDVTTNSWSQANLSIARGGMGVAAAGNKIVFAGGYTKDTAYNVVLSKRVDIYDAITGTWSASELPAATNYSCAASSGNKILFARGQDISSGNISDVVDIYDVVTGIWSTSTLSEAKTQIAVGGTDNKIVFAGGWGGSNGFSKTVDIYDVTTGIWTH